jgi:hypothetical protein
MVRRVKPPLTSILAALNAAGVDKDIEDLSWLYTILDRHRKTDDPT